MEIDPEMKGNGNAYTTEFRQYDPRLGRWMSLDPLMAQFPWMSPYVAFDNNPVFYTDPMGLKAEGWGGKEKEGGGTGWTHDDNITAENYKSLGYTSYTDEGFNENFRDGNYVGPVYLRADGGIDHLDKMGAIDEVVIYANADQISNSNGWEPLSEGPFKAGEYTAVMVIQDGGPLPVRDITWDAGVSVEGVHTALDGAGMIPVIGEPIDAVNGLIYACEGDWGNAVISFAAMVPIVGSAGTAGRLGKKLASEVIEETEEKVFKEVSQNVDESLTMPIHGNSAKSGKSSGHYEIEFESGKTYNGVGGQKRMNNSARKLEKKYGDKVTNKTHTTTKNRREAYLEEHKGIQRNGGAGNKRNYNKINSPGKKLSGN